MFPINIIRITTIRLITISPGILQHPINEYLEETDVNFASYNPQNYFLRTVYDLEVQPIWKDIN